MSDKIIVCDHKENAVPRQPPGDIVGTFIAGGIGEPELPPIYADFAALDWCWRKLSHERIGFFGRRKYILFQEGPVEYKRTDWGPLGWYDATYREFDEYRNWLANWDGQQMKEELAQTDIIVTPPWRVDDLMNDFGRSRSMADAGVLGRTLYDHGVNTTSTRIYPYIFATRWSVFDRFMKFAVPFAKEIEPYITADDSTNEAYKKRPMAYVLERAFSLWLENSGLNARIMPILNCWEM